MVIKNVGNAIEPRKRFAFEPLRRCPKAEAVRASRDQSGGQIWEVKITSSQDYHKVGDLVILELV